MIIFLSLLLLAGALLLYAHWIEPSLLVVRKQDFNFRNNAGDDSILIESQKLHVVWFSDTHFGEYYSDQNIKRIMEQINRLNPDLVLFGGDLMDSYYRSPPDLTTLLEGLSGIKATYGKFAVYGNHDYGGGAGQVYTKLMEDSGFRLLQNESIQLEEIGLSLSGLDDYLLGHPDTTLTENIADMRCNVLLSHAPDLADRVDLSNTQLVLSGHTHGGQVYLPIAVNYILPPGGKKYRKGIYSLGDSGNKKLFVSSGIGMTQIPFRLVNPPEIISLTLHY